MHETKRCSGFTLVEVAVALAILALALGVLYESFGWGLRRTAVLQQRQLALLTAQSLMAEFRGSGRLRAAVETGHTPEGLDWQRSVHERKADMDVRSSFRAFDVTIEVSWGAHGAQRIRVQSIETGRIAP